MLLKFIAYNFWSFLCADKEGLLNKLKITIFKGYKLHWKLFLSILNVVLMFNFDIKQLLSFP
jgi:hypothetical protein